MSNEMAEDASPQHQQSNVTTPNNNHNNSNAVAGSNVKNGPSAVEFEPPLACVRRILKNSLPSSTNVGKDASTAFARACGIFIIYLTACANDFAREHKRQTITANDVIAAMKELEFEEFVPDMTSFLEAYRATEKSKKDAKAKASAAAKKAAEEGDEVDHDAQGQGDDHNTNNNETPAKTDAEEQVHHEEDDDDDDDDDDEDDDDDDVVVGDDHKAEVTEAKSHDDHDEEDEEEEEEDGETNKNSEMSSKRTTEADTATETPPAKRAKIDNNHAAEGDE